VDRTEDVSGGVLEARQTYRLSFTMRPPSRYKEQWQKDPAGVVQAIRASLDSVRQSISSSSFKAASPIFENMTIEQAGEEMRVDSAFPSTVVADTFTALGPNAFDEILRIMR
jgi:hypothetical protein